MIAIDNVLLSDDIVEKHFVCDLNKCKGACCEDGDAGAPLNKEELDHLIEFYELIKPYMTPEGINEVEKQGKYIYDSEFGWVTPTFNEGNGICAYAYRDENKVIKCAIEKAFLDGKITWKKPLSCHLFPIRIKQSEIDPDMEYVNYELRTSTCSAACKLGKQLKVPVYVFLKEPLIKKYGEEFYAVLEQTAKKLEN